MSTLKLTRTIKFNNEYDFEGKKFSSCEMRKPKFKDRKNAIKAGNLHDYDEVETEALLFSNLTSLPLEFFNEELYDEDYKELQEGYKGFLGSKTTKSDS
jgi:hypothetical protein